MLVALFTILFLGRGTDSAEFDYISDTRKSVKTVVVDDERRKDATSTLKAIKKRSSAHGKSAKKTSKRIVSALAEHDGSEVDIKVALGEYFAMTDAYNIDMINLRFELKEQLTREEWQALFSQP
jgi:hypothetical protein